MTEEKRKSVRVWCDGWYGILFNVNCILPSAQRNVLRMKHVVKLPSRWGVGVTYKIKFVEGVNQTQLYNNYITEGMEYGC